jgi:hypothetical protein
MYIEIFLTLLIVGLLYDNINQRKTKKKNYKEVESDRLTSQKVIEKQRVYHTELEMLRKRSNEFLDLNLILKSKIKPLELSNIELQLQINEFKHTIEKKDKLYENLQIRSPEGRRFINRLYADFLTLQYSYSAHVLDTKKRPATIEAERIHDLQLKTIEFIEKYKILEYQLESLLFLFPDLQNYIDGTESNLIQNILEIPSPEEEEIDTVKNFISEEEYIKLDEEKRNQLALDRYISDYSKKSPWQIGRDYELSIGYQYEQLGYNVHYTGIVRKLEDLGRDLIVQKGLIVEIVQCKCWRKDKTIHEKHISQLFGTSKMYEMEIQDNPKYHDVKVIPRFITTAKLSPMAKRFADYLKVEFAEGRQFTEFPRVKCNINKYPDGKESKIYHLPMDQQYDKTLIKNPGEIRVYTIKEAIDKGFRRAYKYRGN